MTRATVCVLALAAAGVLVTACADTGDVPEAAPARTEAPRTPEAASANTEAAPAETTATTGPDAAQASSEAAQAAPATPKPRPKLVNPMKGTAVLEVLRPVVKVQGKEVVTTLKLKNQSYGPVAGLRVDEYWYDKGGNLLPGDSYRHKAVLMPGEEVTVELRTPRDPRMDRNSYQFTHANGKVRADTVAKFSN